MKDKVVIITGGSGGMGKAIAKKLVQEGSNVVITGRTSETLERAKKEMKQYNRQVLIYQMDVRNIDQVKGLVKETKKAFGKIDHLVNNAAGNFICPAEELSSNGWNAVINIVLNGTWNCTQAVGKEWIENGQKGSILNIVATTAWMGSVGNVHSASAKAGVLAMARTLAVEWGYRYGIRVNCLAPGIISDTGGVNSMYTSDEHHELAIESIPLGRYGRVDEIANLAYFLLSPQAEYINGECVTMDGGNWLYQKRMIHRLENLFPSQ